MQAGDHLVSPRTGYSHHGVYVGNDRVVHYAGFSDGFNKGVIEETTLDEFSRGNAVHVRKYIVRIYDAAESVDRAYSRLGEDLYNLLCNNCEHFATWCVFGLHSSDQVNTYLANGAAAVKMYLDRDGQQRAIEAFAQKVVSGANVRTVLGRAATSYTTTAMAGSAVARTAASSIASGTSAAAAGIATGGLVSGSATTVALVGGSTVAALAAPAAVGVAAAYTVYKIVDWLTGD